MLIRMYLEQFGQDVVKCQPDDSAEKIADLIATEHVGAMPVCNRSGEMIGIVSERDLVRGLSKKGRDVVELRARDIMTENVITCSPDEPMARVRQLMHEKGFRHVPVLEGKEILGVISVRDALKTRLDQKELEVNVLKDTVIAARNR